MEINPVKMLLLGLMGLFGCAVIAFAATGLLSFVGLSFVEWFRVFLIAQAVLGLAFGINRLDSMIDHQSAQIRKQLEEKGKDNGER